MENRSVGDQHTSGNQRIGIGTARRRMLAGKPARRTHVSSLSM
jgi:hypothetical protein